MRVCLAWFHSYLTYAFFHSGISSNFVKECEGCQECKWGAESSGKQLSLRGRGHSEEECVLACYDRDNCNFASRTESGYCHLSQYCVEKSGGSSWTTHRKKAYIGIMTLYSRYQKTITRNNLNPQAQKLIFI